MFTDLDCTGKDGTTTLSRDELMLPTCSMEECFFLEYLCSLENCDWWWACSRKLSIGGINIGANTIKSAVVVFNDSSCANDPVQIIAKNQLTCSPQAPTCTELSIGSNGMYQDRACIGDVAAFAESRFTSSPYLIIEKYKDGTYCGKEKETVVYKADGMCYYSYIDGVSVRILPSFGDSVTIIKYQTTLCVDSDAEIVAIGSKYINTGVCYAGNMKLYGNMTTPSTSTPPATTPPSMDIDQKTREEIMFPAWLWEPTPRRIFEDP